MRTLLAAMVVISVWCGVALAKPKVAILGLEVIVSDTKADTKDVRYASDLTEALRRQVLTARSKFDLAPNSNRELLDEKVAGSCDTENPSCMAPIGSGLGADYLVYGRMEKATEKGRDGYRTTIKLLNVKERKLEETSQSFVSLSQLAGGTLGDWAQEVLAKLAGESPPLVPPLVPPRVETEPATVTPTGGQTKTTDAQLEAKPTASSLTLGKGKFLLAGSTVNLDISSNDDNTVAPTLVSFAPSVWYGLNDKITIGITHDFGATPWTPRPAPLTHFTVIDGDNGDRRSVLGAGLCVSDGCPTSYKSKFYNSIGTDILYSLKQGSLSLVAHPGVDVTVNYPFALDLRLGVLGRYTMNDKISVVFDPRLRFGVFNRSAQQELITSSNYGVNHDTLDLPIWTWFAISSRLSVYLHTGFNVQLAKFADLAVPLQIGGNLKILRELTLGLDFGFRAVNDSLNSRALGVRIIFAP